MRTEKARDYLIRKSSRWEPPSLHFLRVVLKQSPRKCVEHINESGGILCQSPILRSLPLLAYRQLDELRVEDLKGKIIRRIISVLIHVAHRIRGLV